MKAQFRSVASLALSRNTRAAAGASSFARLAKAAVKVSSGCPSFGGQRTLASARIQEDSPCLSRHLPRCDPAQDFEPASMHQSQRLGCLSRHPSSGSIQAPLLQLACTALVCFTIQIQGKIASPRAWPNPSFKRTRSGRLRRPPRSA
jgi:hypothetical protein